MYCIAEQLPDISAFAAEFDKLKRENADLLSERDELKSKLAKNEDFAAAAKGASSSPAVKCVRTSVFTCTRAYERARTHTHWQHVSMSATHV